MEPGLIFLPLFISLLKLLKTFVYPTAKKYGEGGGGTLPSDSSTSWRFPLFCLKRPFSSDRWIDVQAYL